MIYRSLGNTDLNVSVVGFGAWGIGGDAYGPVNDNVSREALRVAYEQGLNFFDTSDLYGNGHSEELIGEALQEVRQQIVLATKVGTLPHFGFEMPQDFSPTYIKNAVEQSLRRLRTDYIDLYQLHSPPTELLHNSEQIGETLDAIRRLKDEGKVRLIGISARSPADSLFAARELGVDVIQINFNLIDQRALENGLLSYCEQAGIGVIARTPFAFGFLTGKYAPGVKFYPPDHRSNWPQEQLDLWAESPRLFSSLNAGANNTMAQLALLFCLAQNAVSTVIPGAMNKAEVIENIGVAALPPLTEAELLQISQIYSQNTFYIGRKTPGK